MSSQHRSFPFGAVTVAAGAPAHPSPPQYDSPPPYSSQSPTNSYPTESHFGTSPTSSTFPSSTIPHFSEPPEHPDPKRDDAVYAHGSPLSSRLHRRLGGIRAAIAREQLTLPPGVSPALSQADETHNASAVASKAGHPSPPTTPAAEITKSGNDVEASWSPSAEAGETQRREMGWPGLGLFIEESRRREEREARESGWGWPGLGWVEYRPGRH